MTANIADTTVTTLKARHNALQERASHVATTLEDLIPLNDRSLAGQLAYLLALADTKRVQELFEGADQCLNGVTLLHSTQEEIEAEGGIWSDITEMAEEMLEQAVNMLGVSKEVVKTAAVKDYVLLLDHIEEVIKRAESNAADVTQ